MIQSRLGLASFFSALAIAGALAVIHARPAAAQTASNVICDGCVHSGDIRDGTIRTQDLAPSVLFGRTILVPYAGSAVANCDGLLNALAQVDDASVENPVLIKLARGNYLCGTTPIAMKPFVTIEGAGRSFSRIIGNAAGFDQGVVTGANEAALRHLTVEHSASGSGTAIAVNTLGRRMSLTDVAIKLDSETVNQGYGVYAAGGILDLTNLSVRTSASNGQSQGIHAESGARLNMMNVWIHNQSGAFGNPAALELRDTSSATGYGILFSSNFFGLLGRDNSVFELVDGTVIGGRGAAGTPSFTCVGIADADFTARATDCT
jgi:hypothetical protein